MNLSLKHIFIFLISFIVSSRLVSQELNLPMGLSYARQINYEINRLNTSVHTGFKPLVKSEVIHNINIDSILYNYDKSDSFFIKHKKNWVWRKLLFEDFISVEKESFDLIVNPLFYMELGKTKDSENLFINTRGIEIKGNIGKSLSFYSSFRENQAKYRDYIYEWSWDRLVVPGQGALKKNNNDLRKFDFSSASAYLSFSPIKHVNVQVGQDKIFIGEGYRSMLISDNASNYPFIKLSYTYNRFKYVSMFTQFSDFEGAYYHYHFKKHGAFNYLSYNYKNKFEIGLFEGVIYRTSDTAEYINRFKADYFIPLIGLKTGINGFQSDHNVIVGLNAKLKITNYIQAYGQFAIDDPQKRKFAYQGGLKWFDVFHSNIKNQCLYLHAEYNLASARTYSHPNLKYQTWSHYNQELAHPGGSDFSEILANLNYTLFNFYIDYTFNYLSLNRSNSYSDIYYLDNESYLAFPPQKDIMHHTVTGGYIINPRTNLQVYLGVDSRIIQSETKATENFFMIGIKTGLSNFYYDF